MDPGEGAPLKRMAHLRYRWRVPIEHGLGSIYGNWDRSPVCLLGHGNWNGTGPVMPMRHRSDVRSRAGFRKRAESRHACIAPGDGELEDSSTERKC